MVGGWYGPHGKAPDVDLVPRMSAPVRSSSAPGRVIPGSYAVTAGKLRVFFCQKIPGIYKIGPDRGKLKETNRYEREPDPWVQRHAFFWLKTRG